MRHNRRTIAWRAADALLLTAAVLAVTATGLKFAAGPAEASHWSTPNSLHLGVMHDWSIDEDFCTESSHTTRSWSTAQTNISNALWIEPPSADQKWDAKGYEASVGLYRVWFWAHWENPCQLIPQQQRNPITIEYWLYDNNSATCGATTGSCALALSPYTDSYAHAAYRFYQIDLYAPYTVGEVIPGYYRHQVNHETGHALGLSDGNGTCPDSIMHSTAYGCSQDRSFPSSGDTSSETTRIFN